MPIDLSILNDQQRAAVTADHTRPVLVIAGPGSGKTLCLTLRIAYLVECGVEPWGIYATTFTRKAADEMKGRLVGILGEEAASRVTVNTIHGLCLGILRQEGLRAQVMEEHEQRGILEEVLGRRGVNWDVGWQYPAYWIRRAKGELVRTSQAEGYFRRQLDACSPDQWQVNDFALKLALCYRRYEEQKRLLGLIDFDDMVMEVGLRLREDDAFRERWQARVSHVLVDELQDTARVPFEILKTLAEPSCRLFAVGDPRQSIFKWSGADPDYSVYGFQTLFPGGAVLPLEVNYRSTKRIVVATNAVMAKMFEAEGKQRYRTEVRPRSDAPLGEPVEMKVHANADDEAEWAVDIIADGLQDGLRPADFFVLYRVNSQSRAVEDALAERKVPYVIQGSRGFWERKVVRDVLAYLGLVYDQTDDEAFRQVANIASARHPTHYRGFGMSFFADCRRAGASLWEGMLRLEPRLDDFKGMGVRDLVALVEEVRAESQGQPARAIGLIRSLCYDSWLRRKEGVPEDADVAQNESFEDLEELMAAALRFRSIKELLEHAELMRLLARQRRNDLGVDAVVLSTIHRVKGLERRTVIAIGVSEGILPHWRSDPQLEATWRQGSAARDSLPVPRGGDVGDERCAAFVLVSRARERVYLSATEEYRGRRLQPSRFLAEIGLVEISQKVTPSG